MRARSRAMVAATFTSVALLASACGGGGSTPDPQAPGSGGSAGGGGGEITVNGCTPENPLVPGNTSEVCGGNVLDVFVSKLVHYNADTAAPELDIAEAIETEDNQNFTVSLKQGYMFHDGTEVKAANFVDAWNYTAAAENGQTGSYFYSAIEGYAATQCGDEGDCEATPAETNELSGLAVVDDYTFTIKTTEKVSNLPVRLGYTAFAPLPDAFFDDQDAYEAKPIGAGPFQVESISSTDMVLTKFADYSGEFPASADRLTFRIYEDLGAAYNDVVAGNLDVIDSIPPDQLVGDLYQTDLQDRWAQKETGSMRWITFSPADEQLKDNTDLKKALSMAVDRQAIADTLFSGSATPATGWVSPVVDGYKADQCGEACVFDVAKAKALYEQAGGYEGTLTYSSNTKESPINQQVGEAICNQISNNLGVECTFNPVIDFATYNTGIDEDEYKGMLRAGWQMDYPSIENFLTPIHAKGADSNWADYDSPEFEELLTQAAAAEGEEANTLYQQAESKLAEDFPVAPLLYGKTQMGWSDRVDNVKITAFGTPDLASITVK